VTSSIAAASANRGNRFARSMATRSCERLRRVSAVRIGSCAVAFPYARRSATRRCGPSRPGRCEWSFPLLARRRSWGSSLRRFIPAHGWLLISEPPDPHAFSSRRPTRLVFVELAQVAGLKLRVRESWAKGLGRFRCWLLGVSRERSVSRLAGRTRARWHWPRSILPWASPLSGFWACCTVHVQMQSRGLEPA
jgi:hypothetical protein